MRILGKVALEVGSGVPEHYIFEHRLVIFLIWWAWGHGGGVFPRLPRRDDQPVLPLGGFKIENLKSIEGVKKWLFSMNHPPWACWRGELVVARWVVQ